MSDEKPTSVAKRRTAIAATLGIVALMAGGLASLDSSPLPDTDEVRTPLLLISAFSFLVGIVMGIAAAGRARRDRERGGGVVGLIVAGILLLIVLTVAWLIWVFANAGLS